MIQKLEAVVEKGALKLSTPVHGLADGKRVHVLVAPIIEPADYEGLSEQEREELFWEHMQTRALLDTQYEPAVPPPTGDFKPIEIQGPPLSQTILEDRG